jgi:hypothetical protein
MNRCNYNGCNKKLSFSQMITSKCKCEKVFCDNHRLSESHQCDYNFKLTVNKEAYIQANKCVNNRGVIPI